LLSLFVLPAIYKLIGWQRLARPAREQRDAEPGVGATPAALP
jgi:hypothetical protein